MKIWKLCWFSNFSIFTNFFLFFQANFQMLSPLKFVDWLTSNFVWGILGRVTTKCLEIMLIEHFLHFFSPIFKCYLFWSSRPDWLQILREASWGGSLPKLSKLCWFSNFVSRVSKPMGFLYRFDPLHPLYPFSWRKSRYCGKHYTLVKLHCSWRPPFWT